MNTNGTLKYWVNPNPDNSGLNDKGDPINIGDDSTIDWSEPIFCLFKVNTRDTVGYMIDGNKFQTARYIIHIEADSFKEDATIQLSDNLDRDLGIFKVRDLQRSKTCNRIKILV